MGEDKLRKRLIRNSGPEKFDGAYRSKNSGSGIS